MAGPLPLLLESPWRCGSRGLSGGQEEAAHGETMSVLPSAILYLNGDFDGGAFYFTELDAKTVTVSVPSCLSLGARNPHSAECQGSPPQTGGLRDMSLTPLTGHLFSPDPSDPVSPLKAGYSVLCTPHSVSPSGRGAAPVREGRGILFRH